MPHPGRRGWRAARDHLAAHVHAGAASSRCAPASRAGRPWASRCCCSCSRCPWCPLLPDPVHRHRQRGDPRRSPSRRPPGASAEAVLARTEQVEDAAARRPGRDARPDEHPGRRGHRRPDPPGRLPGPLRQQRPDDRPPRGPAPTSTPRPRSSSPTLAPAERRTATTSPSAPAAVVRRWRRPVHRGQRRGPGRHQAANDAIVAALAATSRTSSTSRATSPRACPGRARRRGPQPGHHARLDHGPGRERRSGTCSWVSRWARSASDGAPTADLVLKVDSVDRRLGRGPQGTCPSAPLRRRRWAPSPTSSQVRVAGLRDPRRRRTRGHHQRRHRDRRPGRRDHGRHRRSSMSSQASGAIPAGVTVELAGVAQQQSRGLRQPVPVDGRGHPAGVRRDGVRVRLARRSVRHPVQPAARDHRRLPGAAHLGPAASASAPSSAS